MDANEKRAIELLMEDDIMEVPISFEIGEERFCLYPMTLGKAYLVSREREAMASALSQDIDIMEYISVSREYRRSIARIVAIQTLRTKREVLDSVLLEERISYLYDNLNDDDLFRLYDLALSSLDHTKLFIKYSGLDKEKSKMSKIARHKADGGSISFGGRTPYGSIISPLCEKYGWTMHYVVWQLSLTNLEMMLADAPNSVYLSKEDRKILRIGNDSEIIDANDPANLERMKKILSGK